MRSKCSLLSALFCVIIFCSVQHYRNRKRRNVQQSDVKRLDNKRVSLSCDNSEECFDTHMNNPGLTSVLRDRCIIGSRPLLYAKNLTFTHIPKCGGSSLRYLLNKHFRPRFHQSRGNIMGSHVPFFLSQKQQPHNIFFTVLREPTSLAISLYNYINMHKTMPKHLLRDKFWVNSYKRDAIEWSNDPFIRTSLRHQVLRFFTWYSKTAKYDGAGTASFSNPNVWREFISLPESYNRVVDQWVPLTHDQEEGFLNVSLMMPPRYRCSQELNVALILIKRYSAVGVVEKYRNFFHVLHYRARLDDDSFRNLMTDSTERKNPSTNKISSAKIKIVKSNLEELFFCSRVLWKVVSAISDHDFLCVSNNSQSSLAEGYS